MPSSTNRSTASRCLRNPSNELSCRLHGGPRSVSVSDRTQLPSSRPGDNGGGALPDLIPNSEVKPSSVDGTAWETAWESRTSPGLLQRPAPFRGSGPLSVLALAPAVASLRACCLFELAKAAQGCSPRGRAISGQLAPRLEWRSRWELDLRLTSGGWSSAIEHVMVRRWEPATHCLHLTSV